MDRHWANADKQMVSTDEGSQIDENMKQRWNAKSGIHGSFEPDSNVITERHWHDMKQAWPRLSPDDEMQID
jgi:hypothetical protein